jgi:4-hydroxy-2-oxoheptanedioate aldolase
MKANPVKSKLREGQPTFGTWMSTDNLTVARLLARLGFDWLTLDLEHSPTDWREAAAVCGAIAEAGCVPLIRVPEGSHHYIKRALDAGAWGIVVPMVNTVEQARSAIAAAKYPPVGNRSVGGSLPALGFGTTSDEYFERANDEVLVVLQTESPIGVENAPEIYRLPGCDAIFIGPFDLGFNLRTPGGPKPTPEEHEAMVQRVIAIGKEAGTPTGIHVLEPEQALERVRQGMQFLAIGSELRMMLTRAREIYRALYPDQADKKLARY